ncbi:conserved hypothetical protein, partial [Ricinus communis]
MWYIRQLAEDASTGTGDRIDAPIGAFGYMVDVREDEAVPGTWTSLNQVTSKAPLTVTNPATAQVITLGHFTDRELPYQVYPSQLDGDPNKPYWLPMYFATWKGKSMVLPDDEASALYQHDKTVARPEINVSGPPANKLNAVYAAAPLATPLRYGHAYQFRVRLADMSGGGPHPGDSPQFDSPSHIAKCRFRRFIAPDIVRISDVPANTGEIRFSDTKLTIRRPLLGYPSVVFTGKYADPIPLLQNASNSMKGNEAFGISDPDVEAVEIVVEVQTLKMDNMQSVSGRESYIHLYTTTRKFPLDSMTFDDILTVPLQYKDCKVLNFGDPADLGDLGVNQAQLETMQELVLPRARTLRLTIRA